MKIAYGAVILAAKILTIDISVRTVHLRRRIMHC